MRPLLTDIEEARAVPYEMPLNKECLSQIASYFAWYSLLLPAFGWQLGTFTLYCGHKFCNRDIFLLSYPFWGSVLSLTPKTSLIATLIPKSPPSRPSAASCQESLVRFCQGRGRDNSAKAFDTNSWPPS
jgi:hypothetical protein